MKKLFVPALLLCLMTSLSGCSLIEDGFKAGIIFTVIIVAIIGIIIWAVRFSANLINQKFKVETIPVNRMQTIREV